MKETWQTFVGILGREVDIALSVYEILARYEMVHDLPAVREAFGGLPVTYAETALLSLLKGARALASEVMEQEGNLPHLKALRERPPA
ncbi:MAG: hypothetical protein MUC77_04550 [Chromatiaceae bacterium]|jgi:hypothetical protein|nr:hypothetical protein [Chromatiaceae bacterium]